MKEFRPFRLDTVNQCLWRRRDSGEEERVLLKPKPYAILLYLADHAGRLVTQDELLDAVWNDVHVQPEVLKRHILDIRSTLGDDPKNPVFIETLPRRGYRFVAPIEEGSPARIVEPAGPGRDKLVGRKRKLGELWACLQRALSGQRQIIFVTGESGIGKTSLVDEFQRLAKAASAIRDCRGQCVEGYGGKEAYYPMLEALGALCRSPAGDSTVQVLYSHAPTWLVQFPALVKREQRETLHRELLGATRERMLREIGEALETIAATTPLLLILEDLHWADPSTVDLISALARGRSHAKLLFIGTYRPTDVSLSDHPLKQVKQDLLIHQLCHEIALEPLGENDVAEYLGGDATGAELPAGLAALVHRHSGGNPLFMVAALEHMTQRGFLLSRDTGLWDLNVPIEEIDLDVPENLREMIEAQIQRLSPEMQRALEVASVRGVSFSPAVSAAAGSVDPEDFEAICEDLSRRHHMVRSAGSHPFPDGTVSPRYEFAHALYREVFYRRQSPGRRARLHLRTGERLEDIYANHESEVAAELAEHFQQASDWRRAVKYLRLAADLARRRYAHGDAVAMLQQALQFVSRLPDSDRVSCEIEILERLGRFYSARFEAGAALEVYQKLIALGERHGLLDVEIRALRDMALPAAFISAQLFAETAERTLQLSAKQEDPFLRARTRASCLIFRAVAGRWRGEDVESCRQAMNEIERKADVLATAEHRLEYARLQFGLSQYADAHRSGVESLGILLKQDGLNPYLDILYVKNHWVLLRNLVMWGAWGQALKDIDAEAALCGKNGGHARSQEVLHHKAFVHLHAMDFTGVIEICESILPYAFTPSGLRSCHILAGSAEAALGNHDRALDHLSKVKAEMNRHPMMDDWYQSMPLQAGLVELWLRKGDLTQARQEAECFLDVTLATAERTYQGLAWEANARVALAAEDPTRVEECIERGLSTIQGYDVPLAAWRIFGAAAELYGRAGDEDLADKYRVRGRTAIMRLAHSLEPEEPLRETFLAALSVRRILAHAKKA